MTRGDPPRHWASPTQMSLRSPRCELASRAARSSRWNCTGLPTRPEEMAALASGQSRAALRKISVTIETRPCNRHGSSAASIFARPVVGMWDSVGIQRDELGRRKEQIKKQSLTPYSPLLLTREKNPVTMTLKR